MATVNQIARRLQAHHNAKAAGFYGSNEAAGYGRYFGACVRKGVLHVTPDFRTWQPIVDHDAARWHDYNGRHLYVHR